MSINSDHRIQLIVQNLKYDSGGPNRNRLGITVGTIIESLKYHQSMNEEPYFVQEFKNGSYVATYFFGIGAGRITDYKILDKDSKVLGEYGSKNFNGGFYETSIYGSVWVDELEEIKRLNLSTDIDHLINRLIHDPNCPNRNGIGITANEIFQTVVKHAKMSQNPYYVYEWKNTSSWGNFFTVGIRAGRVTGYRVLDEQRVILGSYGDENYAGECFETSPIRCVQKSAIYATSI